MSEAGGALIDSRVGGVAAVEGGGDPPGVARARSASSSGSVPGSGGRLVVGAGDRRSGDRGAPAATSAAQWCQSRRPLWRLGSHQRFPPGASLPWPGLTSRRASFARACPSTKGAGDIRPAPGWRGVSRSGGSSGGGSRVGRAARAGSRSVVKERRWPRRPGASWPSSAAVALEAYRSLESVGQRAPAPGGRPSTPAHRGRRRRRRRTAEGSRRPRGRQLQERSCGQGATGTSTPRCLRSGSLGWQVPMARSSTRLEAGRCRGDSRWSSTRFGGRRRGRAAARGVGRAARWNRRRARHPPKPQPRAWPRPAPLWHRRPVRRAAAGVRQILVSVSRLCTAPSPTSAPRIVHFHRSLLFGGGRWLSGRGRAGVVAGVGASRARVVACRRCILLWVAAVVRRSGGVGAAGLLLGGGAAMLSAARRSGSFGGICGLQAGLPVQACACSAVGQKPGGESSADERG